MTVVACYTMDLYCRHSLYSRKTVIAHKMRKALEAEIKLHGLEEFPHQFTGETWGQCKRNAAKRGWIFHKDGEVTCPKCARRR